jgi:Fe-S-cluster-containing dehydrogenase component
LKKWNLIIDVARCENCNNCMITTRDEHVGNDFPGYAAPQPLHGHNWIKIHRKVRGSDGMVDAAYRPTMCNHCDDAPCIKKAGDGSIYQREDGIVIIDPKKARGRRDLVDACPYGVIFWNEELKLAQKWIFDAHLIDQGWTQPRCQQSCPTGVYWAVCVEDTEMQSMVAKHRLEVLRPELKTRPRVYYKNLHRFEKCFLGGSVVADVKGTLECVSGARIVLKRDGQVVATAESDAFGDFKFDGLEPDSGRYEVEVRHTSLGSARWHARIDESVYAGLIKLQ